MTYLLDHFKLILVQPSTSAAFASILINFLLEMMEDMGSKWCEYVAIRGDYTICGTSIQVENFNYKDFLCTIPV